MQFESDTQVHDGDDAPEETDAVESIVDAEVAPDPEGEETAESVDVESHEVPADEALEGAPSPVDEPALDESGPSVDELEDRLRDLQGAMDKIQSGDLDAAERAIETLEQRMETTRD